MDIGFQFTILGEMAISILLGGIIGLERELANKPAGLRTHMLVAGSTTFLVAMGHIFVTNFSNEGFAESLRADPIRIMQSIVVGLSFIGAGSIIQNKKEERIEGLTTAASLLFVGAIGIGVALGQFYLAAGSTFFILIINWGLGFFEKWLREKIHDPK